MKTLIPLVVTTIAAACISRAEPKFEIPLLPPPSDETHALQLFTQNLLRLEQMLAQAPAPAALPSPAAAPAPPAAPRTIRAEANWGVPGPKGGPRSSRTFVIPQGDLSPEKLAEAEEDLEVMALILEKSVERRTGVDKYMGIELTGSSSGIKNLLVEGHGAIFMLKTKIALLPPPAPKKEETKAKEPVNSEWEEARDELYGPSDIEKHVQKVLKHATMSFSRAEEYDKDKVQALKDSLTDALKSASNIRRLKDDHTVTVVVTSSSPSFHIHEVRDVIDEVGRGGGGGGGGGRAGARVYAKGDFQDRLETRSSSRLLLQAKKSDIDACAKGKLTSDAFREKVRIQIY